MTRQEIFDTVAKHLFEQGERAANATFCLYRGPNGTRCAIGVLIPDDQYRTWFEGCTVHRLVFEYKIPALRDESVTFLQRLQFVHDSPSSWDTTEVMKSRLSAIARDFNVHDSILESLSFKDR